MKSKNSVQAFDQEIKAQEQVPKIDVEQQMKLIDNYSSSTNNSIVIPTIGTFSQCISIIKKEKNIPRFFKLIKIIDNEFGVSRFSSTKELMESVVLVNDKELTVLSGYAHLLLAEQLKAQNYDIIEINKEISKAEALLDFANLGGNSTLLPRVMRLKRRVNWKSFSDLVISCILILIIIVFIGLLIQYVNNSDIDIF